MNRLNPLYECRIQNKSNFDYVVMERGGFVMRVLAPGAEMVLHSSVMSRALWSMCVADGEPS